jgi:beta-lactam-binding protein with PASTA domain
MGTLQAMDLTGDTKLIWDATKQDEVDAAKELFKKLKKKKYLAYSVDEKGKKDEIINDFDPELEKIIMIPPIVGG